MACSSPIFFVLLYFGELEKGIGAWICAGIVICAARSRWDLKNHLWYWIVVVLAFILQVPLVLLVPWNNKHFSYISLLPVGVLDYAVLYGAMKLAEKLTRPTDLAR